MVRRWLAEKPREEPLGEARIREDEKAQEKEKEATLQEKNRKRDSGSVMSSEGTIHHD